MLLYWHQFHRQGKRIETQTEDATMAAHFLRLLLGKPADEMHIRALDASLILYAEHEFNASTFTCRTIASTMADFYSAVTGGIGALQGPLHGGAPVGKPRQRVAVGQTSQRRLHLAHFHPQQAERRRHPDHDLRDGEERDGQVGALAVVAARRPSTR